MYKMYLIRNIYHDDFNFDNVSSAMESFSRFSEIQYHGNQFHVIWEAAV